MPSSLIEGYQGNPLYGGTTFRGAFHTTKFRIVPDFFIHVPRLAAADFSGANSGFWVFAVPKACTFVGLQSIWAVAAASGTVRVKKVLAAATSAPGAAADTNNVDISTAADLTLAANTRREHDPVVTSFVNKLAAGDKVALASSAGAGAGLAGGDFILQFVWD